MSTSPSLPPPIPRYRSYDEVPLYRKQWFFWLMYLTLQGVAIGILISGDVYYPKNGEVKSFGLANRIAAGVIAVFILAKLVQSIMGEAGTAG